MKLRTITVPREGTRAAAVLVFVRTGSKNEEKKFSGISHFLEHMLFKGTKKRPSPLLVAEELDKVGGSFNAFTSEDFTGYYAKVNGKKIDTALDWVSDIYQNPLIPQEEVQKEKGVIKEEINMRFDDPMSHCDTLFQKLLYGDQPAGWDISGSKESVDGIQREDLFSYMESQYTSQNTVVVVAGNIENNIEEKVRSYFSGLREGVARECPPVKEEQGSPAVSFFEKSTDQTHLCLGVRAHNLLSEKRHAQKVIATILGGMMSSRLFTRVREEMGAAYYVQTSLDETPHTGYMVTRAGVDNKRIEDVVSVISKEYARMKNELVGEDELRKAKEYIKGKSSLRLESSDALAYFYGLQELLQRKTHSPEEIFSFIDSVKTEDVRSIAEEIFVSHGMNLALVGPRKPENLESLMSI